MFSNYAAANCPTADTRLPTLCRGDGAAPDAAPSTPPAGPYWSLMFEVRDVRCLVVLLGCQVFVCYLVS